MIPTSIDLIGIPVDEGAGRSGCHKGPAAMRAAGLATALAALGHKVRDRGDLAPQRVDLPMHPNTALRNLAACAGWVAAIQRHLRALPRSTCPVFLGGDHLMAAGTLPAMAARADQRPLFVLWLDAHPDIHDLSSTASGNLHGTPVAYATGLAEFTPHFPAPVARVAPENVCMVGLRSVDIAERARLARSDIETVEMDAPGRQGIMAPVADFLKRVAEADGDLHVSFDVDFLDPAIAPGVGTTVPGGASARQAGQIMEMLRDSGRVTSLELAELNPLLDMRGQSAALLVDLVSRLFAPSASLPVLPPSTDRPQRPLKRVADPDQPSLPQIRPATNTTSLAPGP